MSVEDKLLIAEKLDGMKVDVIEAGFPYASKEILMQLVKFLKKQKIQLYVD